MLLYALFVVLLLFLGYKVISRQSEFIYKKFPSPGRCMPVIGHLHILGREFLHSSLTIGVSKLGGIYSVQLYTRRFIVVTNFETIRQLILSRKLTFGEHLERCVMSSAVLTGAKPGFVENLKKEAISAKGFAFSPDQVVCKTILSILKIEATPENAERFSQYMALLRETDPSQWELGPVWLRVVWFPIIRQQRSFQKSVHQLGIESIFKPTSSLFVASVLHNLFLTFITAMIHHIELQKAVRQEIRTSIPTADIITADNQHRLPYTTAVIYEVLRLSAPVPSRSVKVSDDSSTLSGLAMCRGINLMLNFQGVHMDWESWTEPTEFWPERFMDPDTKTLLPPDDRSMLKISSLLDMQLRGSCLVNDLVDDLFLFGANLIRNFVVEPDHTKPLPPLNPMIKGNASMTVTPAFKFRATALS
jgi:hypothetical protein